MGGAMKTSRLGRAGATVGTTLAVLLGAVLLALISSQGAEMIGGRPPEQVVVEECNIADLFNHIAAIQSNVDCRAGCAGGECPPDWCACRFSRSRSVVRAGVHAMWFVRARALSPSDAVCSVPRQVPRRSRPVQRRVRAGLRSVLGPMWRHANRRGDGRHG